MFLISSAGGGMLTPTPSSRLCSKLDAAIITSSIVVQMPSISKRPWPGGDGVPLLRRKNHRLTAPAKLTSRIVLSRPLNRNGTDDVCPETKCYSRTALRSLVDVTFDASTAPKSRLSNASVATPPGPAKNAASAGVFAKIASPLSASAPRRPAPTANELARKSLSASINSIFNLKPYMSMLSKKIAKNQ